MDFGTTKVGIFVVEETIEEGVCFPSRMFETTVEMCLFLLSSNGSKPSSSSNGAEWVRGCEFVMTLAAIF